MAAGKFIFFDRWVQYEASGDFNFMTNDIVAVPLHSGYTPGTHSHSAFAQISGFQSTASGTVVNGITLSGKEISTSGNGVIKYIADNISGFSAGGDTFQAKYIALYVGGSASAGTVDQPLVGFCTTDASTTGVEGTQINCSWSTGGIAKKNVNP